MLSPSWPSRSPSRRAAPPPPHLEKGALCPNKASWQKLANRIKAPVYCPAWLPDPLVGTIGNRWNNINSVSPDRSYLESFVWQETGGGAAGGELHVNLRGYPGRTTIPTCTAVDTVDGKTRRTKVPCFADPHGTVRAPGIAATMYTVNQDADQWHVLLAWRHCGRALHAERARRPAARLREGRGVPEAGAERPRPDQALCVRFTRKQVVVGAAAAGVLGAAGIYEAVDQLTSTPTRPPAAALGPGAASARRPAHRARQRRRGDRAAAPPRDRHGHGRDGRPPRREAQARGGAGRPRRGAIRRRRPGSASRSPGACRTSAATSPPRRSDTCRGTGAPRSRRCSTRSASRATRPTRSSSRTTSRCFCAATGSITSHTPSRRSSTRPVSSGATSFRKGFAGGGFDGGVSLPKQMAVAAGVGGADLIPDTAELFLGLHLDPRRQPRAAADRESRDARARARP